MATEGRRKSRPMPVGLICPPCRVLAGQGAQVIAEKCQECKRGLCRHLFRVTEPGATVTCWPCVRARGRFGE